jgi:hypothetical protein
MYAITKLLREQVNQLRAIWKLVMNLAQVPLAALRQMVTKNCQAPVSGCKEWLPALI